MILWAVVYVAVLALFVVLALKDPDIQRRPAAWPMAASFAGLALLAVARTSFVGSPLGPGPWLACWLVVAALIGSAGRPLRLLLGTPLDPKQSASAREQRIAKRSRLLTLTTFATGAVIAAILWPNRFWF